MTVIYRTSNSVIIFNYKDLEDSLNRLFHQNIDFLLPIKNIGPQACARLIQNGFNLRYDIQWLDGFGQASVDVELLLQFFDRIMIEERAH